MIFLWFIVVIDAYLLATIKNNKTCQYLKNNFKPNIFLIMASYFASATIKIDRYAESLK